MSEILVVDDDPHFQRLAGDIIHRRGHKHLKATTAAEAIAILETHDVALTLLDMNLAPPGPGAMQGWDVLPHLSCPMMIVAGNADEVRDGLRERGLGGRYQVAQKPLRADDWVDMIVMVRGVPPSGPATTP